MILIFVSFVSLNMIISRSIHMALFYSFYGWVIFQFSSVAQSCLTLCDPMNHSTPGLPVHHQLPEFTQTHVHQVSDAIQPSHSLSSPSPPAPNPSKHQGLFQWVNSSHEMAKVLEFQLGEHQNQGKCTISQSFWCPWFGQTTVFGNGYDYIK